MSGFKLIAIMPLQNCDGKFCKNLTIGTPYKFTNNVVIELDDDKSKIERVLIDKQDNTKGLYKLNNGINVEISAVVGLNGSGKSALIELLYYLIYAISVYNDKKSLLAQSSESIDYKIEKLKKDAAHLYSEGKKTSAINLFKILKENDLSLYKKDFEGINSSQTLIKNVLRKRSEYLQGQKEDDKRIEDLIKNNLAVSIVYETSEGLQSISFSEGKLKYYKYNSSGKPEINANFFFNSFFYSVCLNYSHHSLNSEVVGNWINSLFHKNDGYVTPVVINPMRDEGNFNINRELHLSNERIMSNLTFDVINNPEVSLLNKYELKKFLFFTKNNFTLIKCSGFIDVNDDAKSTITKYYDKEEFNNLKSVKLVRLLLGKEYLSKYTNYQDYALGYLEIKIDKIKNNYSQLFNDINGNFSNSKFMYFLRRDKSHITKKIRQTITFIDKTNNIDSVWNSSSNYDYEELNVSQFKSWLSECDSDYEKLNPSSLMDFALPGFFNIDFEITTKDDKIIRLSDLSSGEQQMIFNINTITYHLYNLQSIHTVKDEEEEGDGVNRLAYKNVSIILDEIEIYYHPEMQRELTFNLLNALENIKKEGQKGIESIHIIYLTHSPFILSDVSSSNILRLNNGKIEKIEQETFAANVHDLLANDFFLEKGFMGEFAKNEINNVIDSLNIQKLEKRNHSLNTVIKNLTSPTEKKKLEIEFNENNRAIKINRILASKYDQEYCKRVIDLVGEPMLSSSLMELYIEAYPSEKQDYIQYQIDRLQNLKKK